MIEADITDKTSVDRASAALRFVRGMTWIDAGARFVDTKFVRSVVLLCGGTAARQVILLAFAPVLTRLYEPDDFGTLAIFVSVVSLVSTISALRYEMAIPLPACEFQAADVFALSLGLVVASVAATSLFLWLLGEWIVSWIGGELLQPFFWLIPLGVFGAGFYQVLSSWMVRHREYSHLARASIAQAVGQTGCQVGAGLFGAGSLGLMVGDVVGQICCAGALSRRYWQTSLAALAKVTPHGVMRAAARYWRFPALSSWAALLNTAGLHLPLILVAIFYDLEVAGWLALSQRILGMPITLLSNSVAKVYLSECARLRHDSPERLSRLFWKTLIFQIAIAGLLVLCVAIPAPLVCGAVFGAKWQTTGWCVLILSPMFAAKLVASTLGSTLDVFEKQGLHIFRELVRLALIASTLVAAAWLQLEPLAALAVLSIASSVAYCVGIVVVWRVIQRSQVC
ncbi:MAG: oligosaccharide flippase family protein [Pirellulales bacterium]